MVRMVYWTGISRFKMISLRQNKHRTTTFPFTNKYLATQHDVHLPHERFPVQS